MTVDRVIAVLGLDRREKCVLLQGWEEDLASWDKAMPDFMTRAGALETWTLIGGRDDLSEAFGRVEKLVEQCCEAKFYAWLRRKRTLLEDRPFPGDLPEPAYFGADAGIFTLMVALSAIPLIRAAYARLGIPDSQALLAGRWLVGTVAIYRAGHGGRPGHDASQMHWLRFYIKGELFPVGRLEYLVHTQPEWAPAVYRNRCDGRLVMLARDGWKLAADGFRAAADDPAAATARIAQHPDRVTGVAIDPKSGRALTGEEVTLDRRDWEPAIAAHDWTPSVHIPGGGGMTLEALRQSFREAREFFRRHFDKEIGYFFCDSWILNPAWEERLPDSNLARFQRAVDRFPTGYSDQCGVFFVFGRGRADWDWRTFECRTSLERAFRDEALAGRPLRGGGMMLSAEQIERF